MRIDRAVHTDVPVTLAVVAVSSLVLLGDFVTNPVDECTLDALHGPWSAAASQTEVLIADPVRRLQAGATAWDPYAASDPTSNPYEPAAANAYARPVGAQPATSWELAGRFEAGLGVGSTHGCSPATHACYNQFSMAFLFRLFAWNFGHTSFESYKINMLFMLVLGAQAESLIKWEHGSPVAVNHHHRRTVCALDVWLCTDWLQRVDLRGDAGFPFVKMWPTRSQQLEKSSRSREARERLRPMSCTLPQLVPQKHLAHFACPACLSSEKRRYPMASLSATSEEDGITQLATCSPAFSAYFST